VRDDMSTATAVDGCSVDGCSRVNVA
jgi:hypothetical protein